MISPSFPMVLCRNHIFANESMVLTESDSRSESEWCLRDGQRASHPPHGLQAESRVSGKRGISNYRDLLQIRKGGGSGGGGDAGGTYCDLSHLSFLGVV